MVAPRGPRGMAWARLGSCQPSTVCYHLCDVRQVLHCSSRTLSPCAPQPGWPFWSTNRIMLPLCMREKQGPDTRAAVTQHSLRSLWILRTSGAQKGGLQTQNNHDNNYKNSSQRKSIHKPKHRRSCPFITSLSHSSFFQRCALCLAAWATWAKALAHRGCKAGQVSFICTIIPQNTFPSLDKLTHVLTPARLLSFSVPLSLPALAP